MADEPKGWKTRGWWTGADDVVRLVDSLRSGVTFPPGAYTLTQALAVRHVAVNPVPFARVGRLRFSRLACTSISALKDQRCRRPCKWFVGTLLAISYTSTIIPSTYLHCATKAIVRV